MRAGLLGCVELQSPVRTVPVSACSSDDSFEKNPVACFTCTKKPIPSFQTLLSDATQALSHKWPSLKNG